MSGKGSGFRRADGRLAVLLASALLHGALAILLLRHLSQPPAPVEGRALQVSLVPMERFRRDRAEPDRPLSVRRDGRPSSRAQPDLAPLSIAPGPPVAGVLSDAPGSDGMRTLRGLAGCAHPARLTAEERERCEMRRWAGSERGAGRLNLDPSGRYVENPEPYLVRKPKNGCRVRATGDVDPMGDSGNTRAGVGCAWSF
jgi:hypothetical protein